MRCIETISSFAFPLKQRFLESLEISIGKLIFWFILTKTLISLKFKQKSY